MRKDEKSSIKKLRLARLATTFLYALLVGAVPYLPHTQSLNPTSQVMGDDNLLLLKAMPKDAGSDSGAIGTFILHIQHIYMLVSTLFFPLPSHIYFTDPCTCISFQSLFLLDCFLVLFYLESKCHLRSWHTQEWAYQNKVQNLKMHYVSGAITYAF